VSLPASAEIVIVGGGVMGVSAAYHLARRSVRDIVLLEREPFFGTESTAKCAGGVRYHFGTEINARLSLLSLAAFERFEEETGYSAQLRRCGYLFVLTRAGDADAFRAMLPLWNGLGIRTEWLSGDEVRARLPLMRYPDAVAGIWGPDDGLADPGAVVQGYVSSASRLGARLLTGVEVTGIKTSAGRVEAVETTRGTIASRKVINAAGAWGGLVGRMAGLDVPIVPLKRQVLVTAPIPEIPSDFPFVLDFAGNIYFHREGPGLLLGWSNPCQAPGFDQNLDEESEFVHLEASAGRMPLLERTGIARRWGGLYEVTPDHHPIIGPVEGLDGFYLLAGFSGHGFMHGPAAGLLLAEEILDGRSRTLDLAPLRLERFARGWTFEESLVL